MYKTWKKVQEANSNSIKFNGRTLAGSRIVVRDKRTGKFINHSLATCYLTRVNPMSPDLTIEVYK